MTDYGLYKSMSKCLHPQGKEKFLKELELHKEQLDQPDVKFRLSNFFIRLAIAYFNYVLEKTLATEPCKERLGRCLLFTMDSAP
jgi:hypothetical protein